MTMNNFCLSETENGRYYNLSPELIDLLFMLRKLDYSVNIFIFIKITIAKRFCIQKRLNILVGY